MKIDAMLIIDMQRALLKQHPVDADQVVKNIKELAYICRNHQIPVLYVRHDGGPLDALEKNTDGWEIDETLYPLFGEKVFDKQYNSAFKETQLQTYLQQMGAQRLIVCGMQSEYCVDATIKVAFEYGYELIVPKGCVTTFDHEDFLGESITNFYETSIWNQRFAQVFGLRELILGIQRDLGNQLPTIKKIQS